MDSRRFSRYVLKDGSLRRTLRSRITFLLGRSQAILISLSRESGEPQLWKVISEKPARAPSSKLSRSAILENDKACGLVLQASDVQRHVPKSSLLGSGVTRIGHGIAQSIRFKSALRRERISVAIPPSGALPRLHEATGGHPSGRSESHALQLRRVP